MRQSFGSYIEATKLKKSNNKKQLLFVIDIAPMLHCKYNFGQTMHYASNFLQ